MPELAIPPDAFPPGLIKAVAILAPFLAFRLMLWGYCELTYEIEDEDLPAWSDWAMLGTMALLVPLTLRSVLLLTGLT